jgi:diguanylate cyclase (GGDEF)-like protein
MQKPAATWQIERILRLHELTAAFQPIFHLTEGKIHGYEGLVRGPTDSSLHMPGDLFRLAAQSGRLAELENLCRKAVVTSFAERPLMGTLFLNISPQALRHPDHDQPSMLDLVSDAGLSPRQVVIELTESLPIDDCMILLDAADHYRSQGFEIALDDLGIGLANLRLWAELKPDYAKIDRHFIMGIGESEAKRQFVELVQCLAENTHTRLVAEGIENHADMAALQELGIDFGQGFYLAHPDVSPAVSLTDAAKRLMEERHAPPREYHLLPQHHLEKKIWRRMLTKPPKVRVSDTLETVHGLFQAHPGTTELPVFENGEAFGLVSRDTIQHLLASPPGKEAYGNMACSRYADAAPLIVDVEDDLETLCDLLASRSRYFIPNGFLATRNGRYCGVGNIHGLVREITRHKVHEARYANPLTRLPGSVTVIEHIRHLLAEGSVFCACRCDLNNLKKFNDTFGYRRGDRVILTAARILADACTGRNDFLGHIGNDDFIVIFHRTDWRLHCRRTIRCFDGEISLLLQGDGSAAENRGETLKHPPFPNLSIGAVEIDPKRTKRHADVIHQIEEALKKAKRKLAACPG